MAKLNEKNLAKKEFKRKFLKTLNQLKNIVIQ